MESRIKLLMVLQGILFLEDIWTALDVYVHLGIFSGS